MVRRAIFRTLVCVTVLVAMGFALSACGGSSDDSDKKNNKALYLKKFLLVDRDLNNLGGTGATNASGWRRRVVSAT
jgi:hypothetical protein